MMGHILSIVGEPAALTPEQRQAERALAMNATVRETHAISIHHVRQYHADVAAPMWAMVSQMAERIDQLQAALDLAGIEIPVRSPKAPPPAPVSSDLQ